MAEYYTVLRRAIAGIDPNVPETRRAVYDKARNALIGQLKAVDPPLTTAEISRQRLELEEAIRRVEREAAAGVAGPPLAPAPASNRAPPPSRPEPAVSMPPVHDYEAPTHPTPQEVFRRAIQEAGMRGAESAERVPARPEVARYEGTAPDLRQPPPARDRGPPERRPDNGDRQDRNSLPVRADAARYAAPEYRRRQAPPDGYRAPPQAAPPEQYEPEPRLAPEYDQDWDRQPAGPSEPQLDRRDRPVGGGPEGRRRGYADAGDDGVVEREPRRSRLPGIILTVLIVAVIGGVGVFAWTQWPMVKDLLADFGLDTGSGGGKDKPGKPEAAATADATAESDSASNKNTDRLLPGSETPGAPAPAPDRVVGDQPSTEGETADAVGDASTAEPLPAAAAVSGDAGTAEKAILYEEPAGGDSAGQAVTSVEASVTWSFVQDGPNGPEVEANLQVPERKMNIHFTLHKNSDDTLPASHLVEVVIDTPADFAGQVIGSIPRIVLKPTEEARGQPLVGAAAKVADGFFWIALSAADADIQSNLSLMKERNWIDLPFVYENGQRAILTFEKGPEGEKAFDQAFAAWGAG